MRWAREEVEGKHEEEVERKGGSGEGGGKTEGEVRWKKKT